MAKDEPNFVEYACADKIATITLNRPDKLNAVSDEVVRQMAEAFRRFDLDPEAEVAILNGRAARSAAAPMCGSASCAAARNSKSSAARRAGAPIPPIC